MNNQKALQEKEKAITEFANIASTIINAIYELNRKDIYILEIKDKYAIIRREQPQIIIKIVGPYLWKYRENIKTGNLDILLKNDFNDEKIEAQELIHDSIDKINNIIESFKNSWLLFSPFERDIIKKKLQKLLAYYSGYLIACKNCIEK